MRSNRPPAIANTSRMTPRRPRINSITLRMGLNIITPRMGMNGITLHIGILATITMWFQPTL